MNKKIDSSNDKISISIEFKPFLNDSSPILVKELLLTQDEINGLMILASHPLIEPRITIKHNSIFDTDYNGNTVYLVYNTDLFEYVAKIGTRFASFDSYQAIDGAIK